MRATVVLIGKNEQNTLPRLTASLDQFRVRGGSILLADTGSTDQTIQVAKDLGITVYETGERFYTNVNRSKEKMINDKFIVEDPPLKLAGQKYFHFANARNYAASLAPTDFILTPDCDEVFVNLDLDLLEKAIEEGYEKVWSTLICSWDAAGNPITKLTHCRMYDRRKIVWKGMVHENLEGEGRDITLPIELHHHPEPHPRTQYLGSLALCAYQERSNDRAAHYFARELFFQGRYKSAIREFKQHIAMNAWMTERAQSAVYMGDAFRNLGKEEEAVSAWQAAYNMDANRRMPLIRLAEYYDKKGDYRRAASYALAATIIPFRQYYIDDESHYRELPYEIAFRNSWYIGEDCREQSKLCFDKALELAPWKHSVIMNWHFYYPAPVVSIVIPSLGRPDKLERLLESIKTNAGYGNLEVIVENDSFEDRQGTPKTFKKGVEKAKGYFIMYLGNDCIGGPDFVLQAVIQMYRAFGPAMDGLVCLNDQIACDQGNKATHWMASKKLLPALGGEFFSTVYEHCFCDNELTERCKALGKYVFAPLAKITHDNALNNGGEKDEVLKIAYDQDRYDRDYQTFLRRKAEFRWGYPEVGTSIDLRKKFEGLDIKNLKVLNIGIGSTQSGLGRQLFHWNFKQLDHIEPHAPFIAAAKGMKWDATEVNFFNKKLQEVDNFGDYDLILAFDVLEHLEKEESLCVLDKISQTQAKLLIFSPLQPAEQEYRPELEGHLSLWTEEDFAQRGLKTELLPKFHGYMDALWAQNWE